MVHSRVTGRLLASLGCRISWTRGPVFSWGVFLYWVGEAETPESVLSQASECRNMAPLELTICDLSLVI